MLNEPFGINGLSYYTLYIMFHETDEEAEFVYVRCARVKSFSMSVGRKVHYRLAFRGMMGTQLRAYLKPSEYHSTMVCTKRFKGAPHLHPLMSRSVSQCNFFQSVLKQGSR